MSGSHYRPQSVLSKDNALFLYTCVIIWADIKLKFYSTMISKSRWHKAQIGESRCWESNSHKLLTPKYQELKIEYWKKIILRLLGDNALQSPLLKGKILDVGCGPSGLVMYLQKGYDITCIDPLTDEYLKKFSYLSTYDAKYVKTKIEDFQSEEKYNLIFGFNSVDHAEDIRVSLLHLRDVLSSNGTMYITLNCHNYSFLQKILLRFSFVLDKPHPHQYTVSQYESMLSEAGFDVVHRINIDDETQWINDKTREKKKKSLKNLLNPGNLFFSLFELFGIQRYGDSNAKTAYSHVAFVCKNI